MAGFTTENLRFFMEQKAELPAFDRIWAWLLANWRQAALIAGIVVVAAGIVSFYVWNKNQTVVRASHALSAVEAQGAFLNRPLSPENLAKVAAEHSGTTVAARALLAAGTTYFTQGKYADAQTQFEKLNREYGESPLRSQSMLGVAASLDAQGKADDAARAYKEVSDRFANDIVMPQAKFGLARIYESQGKFEQAFQLYNEIANSPIGGSFANEAGMKALDLRAKLPAPKPAATVTTNAPAATAPTAAPLLTLPPAGGTNQP